MNTPNRPLPPKKEVALALLQGPSVFVHVDPRKPEVLVPAYFKKQPQLVLQVGLNMAIPIPDLNVDDEGVSCTLSFSRSPFWCKLPWTAVFALVGEDGRGMVWPDEVPGEVAAQMEKPGAKGTPKEKTRAPREAKRRLNAAPPLEESAPAASTLGAPNDAEQGEGEPSIAQGESPRMVEPAPSPRTSPVAVPSLAQPARAEGRGDTPAPPPPASAGAPSKEGPAKKVKRELPSYLRVVK